MVAAAAVYHAAVRPFSAETRRADLERMAQTELDVLVIGGGITGAGIALDAASRGLRVGLVEKDDFASGTSGRSSRLIHGGVRYLEHRHFDVVHESLRERAILLRLAPHLVSRIPMYVPGHSPRQRALFRIGLLVYDGLALGRNVGSSRFAGAREMARAAPGLGHPTGGVAYFECRTDDARLTLEVARTARAHGALVANHARVVDLIGEGRVRGARVVDELTGEPFDVLARVVANAGGVWAGRIQAMGTEAPKLLQPSKGVHLVFRPGAIRTRVGLSIPSGAHDRRYVFVVPWGERVYAGTTDTPYAGDVEDPPVTDEDRAYVLDAVRRSFPDVTPADVVAEWAGLRPLLAPDGSADSASMVTDPGPPPEHMLKTADLSRRHAIYESPPGLLTITGGKLTAYRSMAEELVDRAARLLRVRRRSGTDRIPLGFEGDLAVALGRAAERGRAVGMGPASSARLVRRFGTDWLAAVELVEADPALSEPLVEGFPVLRVEAELARTREMAITEDDVLVRRTRLASMGAPLETIREAARPG